jgi:hypothetical protein
MFMVQLEVNSIRKFVLEMKNPDKLLRGCEKFHEIEPRDIIYLVARKIILENPSSEYHILAGVEVLLLTWNAVYLQRQPEKVRRKLENDILEAYRVVKNDFDFFKDEKLESINLKDSDIISRVKRIFKAFASRKSIESTGASKAIHLINPELFMMWDNEIRRNYHKLHPFYRIKSESLEDCYAEFMKTMQDVAKSILAQKTVEEIRHIYHDRIYSKDPKLMDVFSQATMESLPKMLDECNYVRFKQETDF